METATRTFDNYAAWLTEVDRLMKRYWRINTTDAGLSDDELTRYWRGGNDPTDFVAWFAEKYDLIRFEPKAYFA